MICAVFDGKPITSLHKSWITDAQARRWNSYANMDHLLASVKKLWPFLFLFIDNGFKSGHLLTRCKCQAEKQHALQADKWKKSVRIIRHKERHLPEWLWEVMIFGAADDRSVPKGFQIFRCTSRKAAVSAPRLDKSNQQLLERRDPLNKVIIHRLSLDNKPNISERDDQLHANLASAIVTNGEIKWHQTNLKHEAVLL